MEATVDQPQFSPFIKTLCMWEHGPLTSADVEILRGIGSGETARIAEQYVKARQAGRIRGTLRCLLGRHDWQTPRLEADDRVFTCARCPKEQRISRYCPDHGAACTQLGRWGDTEAEAA